MILLKLASTLSETEPAQQWVRSVMFIFICSFWGRTVATAPALVVFGHIAPLMLMQLGRECPQLATLSHAVPVLPALEIVRF